MKYHIAIPTYKRSESISGMTLKILKELSVPKEVITLFVADKEEKQAYLDSVDKNLYGRIVIGKKGLREQRNFIQDFYPENVNLLDMDDDIRGLYFLGTGKVFPLLENHWLKILETGFSSCEKTGARLWGIYPIKNHFFMDAKITKDLRHIVGPFSGMINTHNPNVKITLSSRTDYERTIKFYNAYGAVIRLNYVCVHTMYYTEKGGLQGIRTAETHDANADALVKEYPHLVKVQNRKGTIGSKEIILSSKGLKI